MKWRRAPARAHMEETNFLSLSIISRKNILCHFFSFFPRLCSLHGASVTTVEGLGSVREGLHPVQERIYKAHGSQCGFCTPGVFP